MSIKRILVPLAGRSGGAAALDLAAAVGRLVYAEIEVLYLAGEPAVASAHAAGEAAAHTTSGYTRGHEAGILRDQAHDAFLGWAGRQAVGLEPAHQRGLETWDVTARWREAPDAAEAVLRRLGPFSDLVVLEAAEPPSRGLGLLGVALFKAERPVLLAPPAPPARLSGHAVLAWDGSPEAQHALHAGLPLLSHMRRVTLLMVGAFGPEQSFWAEELDGYLRSHGIHPVLLAVARDQRPTGLRLLGECAALGADLLVMGACGHSRLHDLVLGSATLDVIGAATLPVMLMH